MSHFIFQPNPPALIPRGDLNRGIKSVRMLRGKLPPISFRDINFIQFMSLELNYLILEPRVAQI